MAAARCGGRPVERTSRGGLSGRKNMETISSAPSVWVMPGVMRIISDWLPLTAAVELIRPLFLGQWPAQGLQHLAVLVAYAVVGFWVALALTRKRFQG